MAFDNVEWTLMTSLLSSGGEVSQESLLLHGPFARKPKRIRTAFSPSQLLRLERAFEKNHYVVGAERKQLASSLSLSETQVSARHPTQPPGGEEAFCKNGACVPLSPSLSQKLLGISSVF